MSPHRKTLFSFGTVTVGIALFALGQSQTVQSVIGNVFLQDTTPGTAQAGHANITGTLRVGQLSISQPKAGTIPIISNNTATGVGVAMGGSFSAGQEQSIALRATATSVIGFTTGVFAETRSPSGTGVYGRHKSGTAIPSPGPAGVVGESYENIVPGVIGSGKGTGVLGISKTEIAVKALNSVPDYAAVYGHNTATSGSAAGGTFITDSPAGLGVYGQALAATGTCVGVKGKSSSTTNGTGVLGEASDQGISFGVYGVGNGANGFGVFSEGNFAATGNKAFMIDHPLDPTGKYLLHYCAEGPDPRNVYQGAVVTGADGYAWGQLPDYYQTMNTDPLIQLTVSDASADFVMVKVSREVEGNRFQVRTNKPRVKVFWRVDAKRSDRWTVKNGAPTEVDKPDMFRGRYLEPELYGKPEEFRQRLESGGRR